MALSDLPDHPFWDFSLCLYAQPKVAKTCLALQDNYGLNVNLLLYCCWTGAQGHKLSGLALEQQIRSVTQWQQEVIQPLRAIRRRMKNGISGFSIQHCESLRQAIQKIELDAEHLEQLRLAEFVSNPKTGITVVKDNLEFYLRVCDIPLDQTTRAWLAILIDANKPQTC